MVTKRLVAERLTLCIFAVAAAAAACARTPLPCMDSLLRCENRSYICDFTDVHRINGTVGLLAQAIYIVRHVSVNLQHSTLINYVVHDVTVT